VSREVSLGESALLEGAAQGSSDLNTLRRPDVHTPMLSDAITTTSVNMVEVPGPARQDKMCPSSLTPRR